MRPINGNIGAARAFIPGMVLSPQGRRSKEDARSSGLAEKDLAFCVNPFT
jgi:hypothetical protein